MLPRRLRLQAPAVAAPGRRLRVQTPGRRRLVAARARALGRRAPGRRRQRQAVERVAQVAVADAVGVVQIEEVDGDARRRRVAGPGAQLARRALRVGTREEGDDELRRFRPVLVAPLVHGGDVAVGVGAEDVAHVLLRRRERQAADDDGRRRGAEDDAVAARLRRVEAQVAA